MGFASPLPKGERSGGISEIQRARHEGSVTKKTQKRDPSTISGPCASPSPISWDARRCGGAMGRTVARATTKEAQQCWVEWVGWESAKKAPEVRPIRSAYDRHRLEACATATTHGFGTIEGRPAPWGTQDDDGVRRLRMAVWAIERRAGRW